MSISVGGINLADSIINLEYELNRTQMILDWIIKNNSNFSAPSKEIMEKINDDALEKLSKKYPNVGIVKKNG